MSRHRSQTSTGHRIKLLGSGDYRISWTVDYYYPGVRIRFPRTCQRHTDRAGAERFAKRWNVKMPEARAATEETP